MADDDGAVFGPAAFFGFLTSRLERIWPLAILVSFAVWERTMQDIRGSFLALTAVVVAEVANHPIST